MSDITEDKADDIVQQEGQEIIYKIVKLLKKNNELLTQIEINTRKV